MIARYARPEMAALWGDDARFGLWLDVELAVCRAMERVGTVPAGTAEVVAKACDGRIDAARILEIETTTRHDVIAFLTHIEELAGPPARWLHLGMTSSDVLDTALALQCVRAADRLDAGIQGLAAALADKADAHLDTPMIGRSHGMHAEPTSAGLTFARWRAELMRARGRLRQARNTMAVGKIAGAVGVYGNIEPAVEAEALSALGLAPETVATQIVGRDRHAEFLNALALLGTAIEQMALGVRHWQRSEVGEAEEGFGKGQKGSSAMPHKKNPILSENLCGLARLLRGYAQAGMEDVALWHERDISHSSVERVALPDATILADFMVARASGLIEGLVVRADRMAQNLAAARGLWASERVLLELVRAGVARQTGYVFVQRCAMAAHAGTSSFHEALAADPDIAAHVSPQALSACFDLGHHLRHARTILTRALAL